MPAIGIYVERYRYVGWATVDFKGRTDWSLLLEDVPELKQWFLDNLMLLVYTRELGVTFEAAIERIRTPLVVTILEQEKPKLTPEEREIVERAMKNLERGEKLTEKDIPEILKMAERLKAGRKAEEILRKLREGLPLTPEEAKKVRKAMEILYKQWLESTARRLGRGTITVEDLAYLIVAKYLELKMDDPLEPIWRTYFGEKKFEDLEREYALKFFNPKTGMIRLIPEVIAAVASRYIMGHFEEKNLPDILADIRARLEREKRWDEFYALPAIEKLKRIGVTFGFENPPLIEGQREGTQRIIRATHIYYLIKNLNQRFQMKENPFMIIFDAEHYVHNVIDPEREIGLTPKDFGEWVIAFHVGAPKPFHPAHEPIDIGSKAQFWIYKYAFALRKKGFGIKKVGYLIFERGGRVGAPPREWMRTTIMALRLIVEFLEKDVEPEKLPPEFYGVKLKEIASIERQIPVIRKHALDPLKGLLMIPEEEWTFLGRIAKEKAKLEEWRREELR
jgi:hypothetical protein